VIFQTIQEKIKKPESPEVSGLDDMEE